MLRTATYRFESFSLESVSRELLGEGKLLHGSQGITVHQPIPTEGSVEITDRIAGMWDKGEGRNAIIDTEASAVDPDSGDVIFELRSSVVIRGSGGFGGEAGSTAPLVSAPERLSSVTFVEPPPVMGL